LKENSPQEIACQLFWDCWRQALLIETFGSYKISGKLEINVNYIDIQYTF